MSIHSLKLRLALHRILFILARNYLWILLVELRNSTEGTRRNKELVYYRFKSLQEVKT